MINQEEIQTGMKEMDRDKKIFLNPLNPFHPC
jgi:hypothetical protein